MSSIAESHGESGRDLADKLHELRTPLNQIIGLSEMLVEIADEEGRLDLMEGLHAIREAGIELAGLLHGDHRITENPVPGFEYWPLNDAVRAAVSRVLGFADLVLSEAEMRVQGYRKDLMAIRDAAGNFLKLVRSGNLQIQLEKSSERENRFLPARDSLARDPIPASPFKGRVLIVDDESLNRELLSRRLQREGYKPVGAHSGRAALQLLKSEPFDVVLLDIQMPEMTGIEVLQALREDPELSRIPVIMLSGLTDVERVARCIELGAEDYLPSRSMRSCSARGSAPAWRRSIYAISSARISRPCMPRRNF